MLSQRNPADSSRHSTLKSSRLILLQTLCRRQKTQLLRNQANPHSFANIPGGVALALETWRKARSLVMEPHELQSGSGALRHCGNECTMSWASSTGLCCSSEATTHLDDRWTCLKNGGLPSTFRINTCKSVSKQRTLTIFRINTYEIRGRG